MIERDASPSALSFADGAADQCGFADQSHLCRVFKTATGLTPLDYRRFTKGS